MSKKIVHLSKALSAQDGCCPNFPPLCKLKMFRDKHPDSTNHGPSSPCQSSICQYRFKKKTHFVSWFLHCLLNCFDPFLRHDLTFNELQIHHTSTRKCSKLNKTADKLRYFYSDLFIATVSFKLSPQASTNHFPLLLTNWPLCRNTN